MLQDFDFSYVPENAKGSKVAYAAAGIKDPRKEISLAEVHDCFSIHEMLIYEDFGFSARGRAREDIEAGTFSLKGEFPVNTDGGLKCFGHPLGASGLRMMYEVYKQLGFGFLESVYKKAMLIELAKSGSKTEEEKPLKVHYDGQIVGDFFVDLFVDDRVVVELKSVQHLSKEHEVQLVNYLKGLGRDIGLLVNFGSSGVEVKRKFREQKVRQD